MGFGGILGALAQGLGNGAINNAKEAYEDERLQKQLDFRSDLMDKELNFKKEQAGLDRDHDFKMLEAKERSEIAVAAAKSKIDLQEYKQKLALGGGRGGSSSGVDGGKQAQDVISAVGMLNEGIAQIDEQIQSQGGKATEEQLARRNKYEQDRYAILNSNGGNALRTTETGKVFSRMNGYDPIDGGTAGKIANSAIGALTRWGEVTARPDVPDPEKTVTRSQSVSYAKKYGLDPDGNVELSEDAIRKYQENRKKERAELLERTKNVDAIINSDSYQKDMQRFKDKGIYGVAYE